MNLTIELFDNQHNQIETEIVSQAVKLTDHLGTHEAIQSIQETLEDAKDYARETLNEIVGDYALIYNPEGIPLAFVEVETAV